MKEKKFSQILDQACDFTDRQWKLLETVKKDHDHLKSVKNLEEEFPNLQCPHCQSKSIGHWGKRNNLVRYRCKSCKRTFNSLTGTPLARLRKKELWEDYSNGLLQHESLQKVATRLGITKPTAFKWRHRFLQNIKSIKPTMLNGIVEADETYILKSLKGCRLGIYRKPRKRGGKATKPGLSDEQSCVFVSRDRNGNTTDQIFENFSAEQLEIHYKPLLAKDAVLYTDSKSSYFKFADSNNLSHQAINLSKGERVRDKVIHVQNVNAYHSRLKSWISDFKGISTKYLESYLGWFRLLDEPNIILTNYLILRRARAGGIYGVNL
jgi:transposase-like protein